MEPINFCYWLQGYMELSPDKPLSVEQVKIIQDHLNLVFNKVTPDRKNESNGVTGPCGKPEKIDLSNFNKNFNPNPHTDLICNNASSDSYCATFNSKEEDLKKIFKSKDIFKQRSKGEILRGKILECTLRGIAYPFIKAGDLYRKLKPIKKEKSDCDFYHKNIC